MLTVRLQIFGLSPRCRCPADLPRRSDRPAVALLPRLDLGMQLTGLDGHLDALFLRLGELKV